MSTDYDVEKGDSVHPGKPVTVDRYTAGARVNHWITAISLVLLALSGLALFHPRLFFLTGLFGGGPLTRIIHPWIGVLLFFSFFGLFLRFWKANLWKREDGTWMAKLRDVIAGHDEKLPEVGKYNAGQKMVFWSMSFLIIVLITSGVVIWERYFGGLFSLTQQRIAMPLLIVGEVKQGQVMNRSGSVGAFRAIRAREESFSKYCIGTALLWGVSANVFKPSLRAAARQLA